MKYLVKTFAALVLLSATTASNANAQAIMAGDLVLGLGSGDGMSNIELARGPAAEMGGGNVPYGWNQPSLQAIEFDNLDGISHNPQGNLLGASFSGGAPSGGAIFSLGTCTTVSEIIGNTVGLGGDGITETPLGGLSVSPDNSKIAVVGYNTGSVIVYDYTASDCTGADASLSNARQTDEGTVINFTTTGTTWLDNNNIMALSASGDVIKVDATTMDSEIVAHVETVAAGSQFTDVEFNPAIAPYLYLSYSTFNGGATTNKLFVLDPTLDFSNVLSIDLSQSSQTTREIALSPEGHLFIGQFGAPVDVLLFANEIDLEDNSSLDWYTPLGSSNFSGLDVAVGLPIGGGDVVDADFNDDGNIDGLDLDMLYNDIDTNSNSATLDLTGNGAVDSGDVEAWLGDAGEDRGFSGPIRPGDVDFNGIVDASDLNVVGINWQRMDVASWTEGDFDNDGKVAAGDLNGLGVNWLTDITGAAAATAAVPEPASRMMVLFGLLALSLRRRR